MKIITQLVILTLSLLLVNAHDDDYCTNLYKQYKTFRSKCSPANITIDNCCELTSFPSSKSPSGVYHMKGCIAPCEVSPFASYTVTAAAYCDMTTDGGGWIVIQRNRKNSAVNFTRNWTDYQKGFGDLNTDFWYGLDELHCLTQQGQWEMRLDYQFNNKSWIYIHYSTFHVEDANKKYQLTVGGFTGIGPDDFTYSNKMYFSTPDKDNDGAGGSCAQSYKSGWWYNNCYRVNPNKQPPTAFNGCSVLYSEMKIHLKDCFT